MAAPSGNQNAVTHGLRSKSHTTRYRDGLSLGSLPPGCTWIRRRMSRFRLALEDAVTERTGSLDLASLAIVQTCVRWETHSSLCRRWLCEAGLTAGERLAFSKQVASASSHRDACLRQLGLDKRQDASPWDVLDETPAEPDDATQANLSESERGSE